MKKKELRKQLTRVNELVLKQERVIAMLKREKMKTRYSQEKEIRNLTTLLANMKDKVSQLNKALYFKEVYDERI